MQEKRNHFKNPFKKPDFIPKKCALQESPIREVVRDESINNKYKSFNVDQLRENLIKIINFSKISRRKSLCHYRKFCRQRDERLRQELLESKKRELQKKSDKQKAPQGDTAK